MRAEAPAIRQWLEREAGGTFDAGPASEVAGGSVNRCLRWQGSSCAVFLKVAPAAQIAMFEAEAAGLRELAGANALRVPAVVGVAAVEQNALLALEWLDLRQPSDGDAAHARLGALLAMQHRVTAPAFGWSRDNTIGTTLQRNTWSEDWVRFFVQHRLGLQLDLAEQDGVSSRLIERGRKLCERCGAFFSTHRPVPSLLHGDLWAGNWAVETHSREPLLFDPAAYYGDREADIAMTRLFGGFGPRFYAAYQSEWPLDQASGTRRALYNLYHVLNHHHLFGGAYAAQAEAMIDALLAEFG